MSIKILVRDIPCRSVALITDSHALIFHNRSPNVTDLSAHTAEGRDPRIAVEFTKLRQVVLNEYRALSQCKGTLGLISVGGDVFIGTVAGSSKVAQVRPRETVERIHTVEFHCLTRSHYDKLVDQDLNSYNAHGMEEDKFDYNTRQTVIEHPCLAIRKLLSSGTFYFSTSFDLTNRLQSRSIDDRTFDIDNFEPAFLWNSFMISPLIQFRSYLSIPEREQLDVSQILTSAIRGFVETLVIPEPVFTTARMAEARSYVTLISRLSCRRAGTRFNARGMDDEGNVANFVETEVIIWKPHHEDSTAGVAFSYCQVRGSVPVFWEQQPGLLPNQQKIQLSRSAEATQPAFDKHLDGLSLKYGAVHIVNLLSASKPGEIELTERFRYHIRNSHLNHGPSAISQRQALSNRGTDGQGEGTLIRSTEYDFHAETQGRYENAYEIRNLLARSAKSFGFFILNQVEKSQEGNAHEISTVITQQEGIFRTNCLDCLDRTNLVQGIISQLAIESFYKQNGEALGPEFWIRHSTLWADNGDALSKIYAGTGAMKSSYTRHGKTTLAGILADARKSATRMYINKFVDGARQETIDHLLGRQLGQSPISLYDPINDLVHFELEKRAPEYSTRRAIRIHVCTFNVNGRINGINDDLSDWLRPQFHNDSEKKPELVVVAFQEIVELSPQQIMSTDPERRQVWEKVVRKCLNSGRSDSQDEYILLRSGQLVGAALMIFVKSSQVNNIKNVEGSIKKTGMSGMAGNKGAVAIRLEYGSTTLCFLTAHLAAGFANYDERNRDYHTIAHGLRFQRGRCIDDHDEIIWLGDFNYRISLPDEVIRQLIRTGDLETLFKNDQLNIQQSAGLTFCDYNEACITFNPTYKFDIGKDEYDTSEKARIPAWCDRILYKGSGLKQYSYNSAPIRFSDHRPVYAMFKCSILYVDEDCKENLKRKIYMRVREGEYKAEATGHSSSSHSKNVTEGMLVDLSEAAQPADRSTSSIKWWIHDEESLLKELDQQATSGCIYNPQKPKNPFLPSTHPEWIKPDQTLATSQSTTISNPPSTCSAHHAQVASTQRRRLPPVFDAAAMRGASLQSGAAGINTKSNIDLIPTNPTTRSNVPLSRRLPPPPAQTEKNTNISVLKSLDIVAETETQRSESRI